MEANVIYVAEAARQKGCSRQTIYNAVAREELNTVQVGAVTMICKDEKWASYRVQETGGRLHKNYLRQHDNEG